jgi:hypothetical protein
VQRNAASAVLVVNERIAFRVLTEAAFTDDDVVSEYMAGVIAGTDTAEDDGAPVLAQIGRLSALSLRLHYITYREVWRMVQHGEITQANDRWSWWRSLYFPMAGLERVFRQSFDLLGPRLATAGKALENEQLLVRDRVAAYLLVGPGKEISFSTDGGPIRFRAPEPGWSLGRVRGGLNCSSGRAVMWPPLLTTSFACARTKSRWITRCRMPPGRASQGCRGCMRSDPPPASVGH